MPGQIVRHKQAANYTVIPNALARDFTVSAKARGVLVAILSLPEDWDLNVGSLIEWSQEGKDAIYGAMNELVKAGYVSRIQEHDAKGRKNGVSYIVRDEPHPGYPYPDFQDADNPPPTKYQPSQSTNGDKKDSSPRGGDSRGANSIREGAADG